MVRISDHPHKMFEKSLHRRNDSEEIDVFEAAKYFSGTNEIYPNTKYRQCSKAGGHGISLDMSMRKATQTVPVVKENQSKEKKHKQKQPSSPGGRIAKILNALFNQTSLKKGKPKTSSWSSKSVKDDEDSTPSDWRRKRRSSISNFQHIEEHKSSQSFNSGFRTPPAYPQTPKASSSFKDFRSYSDYKDISPYAFKNHRSQIPSLISIGLIKGENLKHGKNGFAGKFDVEDDRYSPPPPAEEEEEEEEEREFTKFSEADGGADSDSSSDLFDLPNCDRNLYSSELPVFESTHIQSIKTTTR